MSTETDLSKLSVVQLRAELKKRKLASTGLKQELFDRLQEAVDSEKENNSTTANQQTPASDSKSARRQSSSLKKVATETEETPAKTKTKQKKLSSDFGDDDPKETQEVEEAPKTSSKRGSSTLKKSKGSQEDLTESSSLKKSQEKIKSQLLSPGRRSSIVKDVPKEEKEFTREERFLIVEGMAQLKTWDEIAVVLNAKRGEDFWSGQDVKSKWEASEGQQDSQSRAQRVRRRSFDGTGSVGALTPSKKSTLAQTPPAPSTPTPTPTNSEANLSISRAPTQPVVMEAAPVAPAAVTTSSPSLPKKQSSVGVSTATAVAVEAPKPAPTSYGLFLPIALIVLVVGLVLAANPPPFLLELLGMAKKDNN